MNNCDFIFARRSVRVFTGKPIARELLEKLLGAAMSAPSAMAKDPWRFIVVEDRERLAAVAEGLPNGKFLPRAAAGIIVCGDLEQAHGGELSYLLQDCSAAMENLLLAAAAEGLGACWLGVHPREDRIVHLRRLFSLPPRILPLGVAAVGYPAETPPPRNRFVASSVTWDTPER
ncbi:MAG: nitroreductase family protein [Victivallales bacterium]|nr:nitroreductase family protein [Victivallales bacterium]